MAQMFSAAGQALFAGSSNYGAAVPGAPQEDEETRRKRLAAIAATQAKLGAGSVANGSALSPAGMALGLGGYGNAG
jgi:hypothetical protein